MNRICDEVLVRMCIQNYEGFSGVMMNYFLAGNSGLIGNLNRPVFETFLCNIRCMFKWFDGKDIPSVVYGFSVVELLKYLFSNLAYYAEGFKVDDCEKFWGYVYGKIVEFHLKENLTTWEMNVLIVREILGIAVGKEAKLKFDRNCESVRILLKSYTFKKANSV